jgi:hypothetical protein
MPDMHGFLKVARNGMDGFILAEQVKGHKALLPFSYRQVKVDNPFIRCFMLVHAACHQMRQHQLGQITVGVNEGHR